MKFKINNQIADIKPYEPGKPLDEVTREYNIDKVIKLASNENPVGYSPKVYDAIVQNMKGMNRYPESFACTLCSKLANKFHAASENIVIGNGSDDLIALLAHGFLNPKDEALMPMPSFLLYEISVKTAKGVPVMVPLRDFSIDLGAIAKKISSKTRLIFITNPFNPTGSSITSDEFQKFAKKNS